MKSRPGILHVIVVAGFLSVPLHAQSPAQLLKDCYPGTIGTSYNQTLEMNSHLYFTAETAAGNRLWRSDGSPGGTVVVKDQTTFGGMLWKINSTLYFASASRVFDMWKSDGTTPGTVLVKKGVKPTNVLLSGNTTFVINRISNYQKNTFDNELWKTNGTSTGTSRIKDLNTSGFDNAWSLFDAGGVLSFTGRDATHGDELWRSNGTTSGTTMVKDVNPGADGSGPANFTSPWQRYPFGYVLQTYVVYNSIGKLYRLMYDGVSTQLWSSDGTANGTQPVTSGGAGGNTYAHWLTPMGGKLYFSADLGSGYELCALDLATGVWSMVADINSNGSSWPMWLTVVGPTLYFSADNGESGRELWKYDGTSVTMVKDINPTGSSNPKGIRENGNCTQYPMSFSNRNGFLYFSADDGVNGNELWRSDGTDYGTTLLADINPGGSASHSDPEWMTFIGSTMYFWAIHPSYGREIWSIGGIPKQLVEGGKPLPATMELEQNYPNPFNPSTMISYAAPKETHVRLAVFDIRGSLVQTLVDEIKNAGNHSVLFDAKNVPSGTYTYRLEAEGKTITKMMTLMK